MAKTFYRTYRPQKFSEMLGQDLVRLTLSQAIKENRISHSYLFTGPRGTGKTTAARIFAKAINCLTPLEKRIGAEPCNECRNCIAISSNRDIDLTEIDAASYTGVDNIRQLTENINLSPAKLRYRVFIIDEAHMLSKGAFNALLKTLEEPPAHTIFILATTEIHKIPLTIISRCQRFSFRLLTLPEIFKKLSRIAKKENIEIHKESLEIISEAAHGGMRDAESLLDQVVSLTGKKVKSNEIEEILGISGRDNELELLKYLFEKETTKTINEVERMNKEGIDIFLLSHHLLDYLRKILLIKVNPKGLKIIEREISESQIEKLKTLAKKITIAELISIAGKIIHSQPTIKSSSFPHLPLELAMLEWEIKDADNFTTNPKPKPAPSLTEEKAKRPIDETNEVKENRKTVSIDFKTVLSKWTAVLQNVRELQPALFSLLKVCSPVKIEDGTLIISTPFKFHKDKLSDGKNRKIFCQELNKEAGIKRICVVQDSSLPKSKVNDDEFFDQVKNLLGN